VKGNIKKQIPPKAFHFVVYTIFATIHSTLKNAATKIMSIKTSLTTAIVIAAITIHTATTSSVKNEDGGRQKSPDFDDGKNDNKASCGLYMATSSTSLSNDHKWGVYAGKDIEANAAIGFGDLAIHTFQLMANNIWMNQAREEIVDDLDKNQLANIVDWFEQFVWVPDSSGGQYELFDTENGAKIVTAVPGTGVLGGYNPKLTNADWNHSSAYHREAWNEFPEEAHPGRGAYTNYFNLELAATEVIPAGREIFMEVRIGNRLIEAPNSGVLQIAN
jgi:hypothetical protein